MRFHAAWAIAVVLAVVLPVAIPYAIWPPAYYDDATDSGDCGSIARDYAAEYTHPIATLWPLSVHVNQCTGGGLSEPGFRYDVDVRARGPYGIPFASAHITNSGGDSLDPDGGQVLGLIALMSGVLAVSFPFGVVFLRAHLRTVRLAAP